MSITRNSLKRPAALFAAAALLVGSTIPALYSVSAAAIGQVSSRSLQLSDGNPSGGTITSGVGSGTAVSYKVTFTAATSTAVGAIVVDICDNTPLIGDTTCAYPASFSWGAATPVLSGGTVSGVTGTWTASSQQGGGASTSAPQVLVLTDATPAVPSGPISFTITGVTNPSAAVTPSSAHTFYARILTFASGANEATDYTVTGTTRPGIAGLTHVIDDGGVAMSLSLPITVTARVMETFTLCTASATYTGVACAGPTGAQTPSIILGDGSANNVLDTAIVRTANVYTQVSTNATNGYALYLKASNSCAGLSKDNGTTCGIPAVNSGGTSGLTITAGTAAFGASVGNGNFVGAGSGTNTAVARWNTTPPAYIMDNTTANDNVSYTYGSKIITSTGQANGVVNTITFAATASPTTPAGIYTENFSLIGVGTF